MVWQKVIKCTAIVLAVALGITLLVGVIDWILGMTGGGYVLKEMKKYTVEQSEELTDLNVECSAAEFIIRQGDSFLVESNLKELTVATEGKTFRIQEKTKTFRGSNAKNTPKLYLTIPTDMQFESVHVQTGAGKVTIAKLTAKRLTFVLGAGQVEIDALTATETAKIDGGAGEITIRDGVLKNLEFNMGVGKLDLTSKVLGKSELNCGIGAVNVTLKGGTAMYTVEANKGLGTTKINGKSISSSTVFGIGENAFSISGGIGDINVDFKE